MRITWTAGSVAVLFLIFLLTILGIVAYLNRESISRWIKSLFTESFNPASSQNVVNRGVSAAVSAATGRDETLGGWLAERFDPSTRAANEMLRTPAGKKVVTPADVEPASDFFFGAP